MIYQQLPNANATVLSVGTTAGTLKSFIETAGSTTFDVNGLDGIDFNVESGSLRVAFDGNTPSTTKGLLVSGFCSFRNVNLARISLVSTSGTISVSIQVGKTNNYESGKGQSTTSGGGGGGTPGSPSGSIQGNNAGSFAGVPNSSIDFTTGVTTAILMENAATSYKLYDDFDQSTLTGWATSVSGGTINIQQTGPVPGYHIGQLRFQTSNTNDRATLLRTANANTIFFGNGEAMIEFAVYLENLSDATNEYELYIGFGDGNSGNPVDGAFIRYVRTSSANWGIGASTGGTATVTNSSVPVVATTWLGLRVVVNAAGNSAEFFIGNLGDGSFTSLGSPITTNIPTLVANICTPFVRVNRTAGTATVRNIWVDYAKGYQIMTTPRF